MPSQERQMPPKEPPLLKTGSNALKASGVSESFMRHCERVHELSEMGLFEEYVRAGQDGMLRGAKSAEMKFLRRHRPER